VARWSQITCKINIAKSLRFFENATIYKKEHKNQLVLVMEHFQLAEICLHLVHIAIEIINIMRKHGK